MENRPSHDSIKTEAKTMRKQRKNYTPEEKVSILRKHLAEERQYQNYVVNTNYSQQCSSLPRTGLNLFEGMCKKPLVHNLR
jgi:hypothetical protein